MALKTPTAVPTRKVLAFTGSGATLGPALAEVVIYLIEGVGKVDLPDNIEKAIYTLLIIGLGFAAAYWVPPARDDIPVPDNSNR